jgi:UDP-N-acetylenolpyruvoylglucosamine reductase
MLIADRTISTAEKLRDRFPDSVVTPADEGYDRARGSFNLLHDQRPAAIATPGSAAETAAIVSAARDAGLRIAPRGSSHNIAPLGAVDDTLVIKLERMTGVELDVANGTARVEAGARWWDLIDQASDAGLAARHGSSAEINIVGYSLGGGVGWMARKHGLQANAVTAVELIAADGEVRVVDADNEPELFWALRGGGGNFGVVTAIEFELVPVREFHAGSLFFEFERAAEILNAYREWTAAGLPDEITSVGRTLQLPDLELIPEIVRGKSFAIIEAIHLGSESEARELLAPLRELGPVMDTFANVPPAALQHLHMDPVEPVPYDSTHAMLGELTERAIDEALAAVGPGAGSPVSFEVRHLGGALSRGDASHGAIDTMRGEFMMFGLAPIMDPAMVAPMAADLERLYEAFAPDDSGRYLNFTEVDHAVEDMFPAGTVPRLRAVKAEYDPEGLFRANHAV